MFEQYNLGYFKNLFKKKIKDRYRVNGFSFDYKKKENNNLSSFKIGKTREELELNYNINQSLKNYRMIKSLIFVKENNIKKYQRIENEHKYDQACDINYTNYVQLSLENNFGSFSDRQKDKFFITNIYY